MRTSSLTVSGQGCLLSTFYIILFVDWILKAITAGSNNGVYGKLWEQLEDLNFADDLVLRSYNYIQTKYKTACMIYLLPLKIYKRKTEWRTLQSLCMCKVWLINTRALAEMSLPVLTWTAFIMLKNICAFWEISMVINEQSQGLGLLT